MAYDDAIQSLLPESIDPTDAPLLNHSMAYDDAMQSLLPESIDPSHLNEKNALKRRKYHRCSSAPLTDIDWPEQIGNVSLPYPVSNLAKQPPSFKQVFMFLAAYLGTGTLCFFLIRNQIKGEKTNGVVDAIYFCVVTMTTVGYGDLVPDSTLAKLLACVFVFTGMALGGLVLSRAADYIVEKQETLLVNAIHMYEKFGPTQILKEVETDRVKYKFMMALTLLLVLIIVGTVFLSLVEKLDPIDAFYCVCSTITTLGYGDESFSTRLGRIFAVFWVLSSTICLAQFFLYFAELYTESRQRSLVKWVLTRGLTFSDIEAADLDHDKVVSVQCCPGCQTDAPLLNHSMAYDDAIQSLLPESIDPTDAPLLNHSMAYDDAMQSLLPESIDPSHLNEKNALKRRKYHRCSSAPLTDIDWPEQIGNVSLPYPVSNLAKQPPSFKQVFMFLAAYLGTGTLCFFLIRNQIKGEKTNGVVDAIYFCVVTMTTVGYGDLVPDSTLAKLLACVFVFTGMALGGLVLSRAADYIVEKQETLLVNAIHMYEKFGPTQILKEVETDRVKYKFMMALTLLLVLIIVGTVFLSLVEKLDPIDAFYCVCSTITTLGYGDESFSTRLGRIFAVFWVLSSTICLAQFFLYFAELYTESRQRSLVKWVLTRGLTFSDIEAADLDHDKVVSAAEFIIFKLKEMGKISQEDVSVLMERFKTLDADQSGTLTASDMMLSQ